MNQCIRIYKNKVNNDVNWEQKYLIYDKNGLKSKAKNSWDLQF